MLSSRSLSHRRFGVVALALTVGLEACSAATPWSSDPGVPGVPGRVSREEKSPVLALLLAIFPGIFVHGLGNLYVGKTDRAEDLMAEEGIGIAAMGISAGLNYLAFAENGTADHSRGVEKVYDRIEEVTYWAGGGAAGFFGLAFFFDSWIRDMMEAPGAAESHNRDVRRLYNESIHPVKPDPAAGPLSAGAPSKNVEAAKPSTQGHDDGTVPSDPATAAGAVAPVTSTSAPGVTSPAPGKR